MKTNRTFDFNTLIMGGVIVALLTACSSADDVTGNPDETQKSYKVVVNGVLPGGDTQSKSNTRAGSFTDEALTGGLNFKWEAESEKMVAMACNESDGIVVFSDNNRYSKMNVIPKSDDVRLAELTTVVDLSADAAGNNKLYCIQSTQTPTVANASKAEVGLAMPANNVFVQTVRNSTSHLTDYLFFSGVGENATVNGGTLTFPNISFNTNVATIRLRVSNKMSESKTIRSVVIKSSTDEKIFPDAKTWSVDATTDKVNPSVAITEPAEKVNYTSSVTAQCRASGFEVKAGESFYSYVAIHQHDVNNALASKSIDFVITTTDGYTYTAYNFACESLSHATGNKDFVSGYTYTFTLSLKENRLILGDVTVNGWGEGGTINGGEVQ